MKNVIEADANVIVNILDTCEISFSKEDIFFGKIKCRYSMESIIEDRKKAYLSDKSLKKYDPAMDVRAYDAYYDFGHTAPCFDDIVKFGIPGLKKRIMECSKKNLLERAQRFYLAEKKVYDALERFLVRTSDIAIQEGKHQIAEGLRNLVSCAPKNMYEAMQIVILFFNIITYIEGTTARTIGRLDRMFMPFYNQQNSQEAEQLADAFIDELDNYKVGANMPFMIGGIDVEGNSMVNTMSYLLLNSYIKKKPAHVKLHLLCHENIPSDIVDMALDGVREGANSIVFMSDHIVIEGLMKIGASLEDATDYAVVGCYECGAKGEVTCSCNGRVNIPKAIELAMNNGVDVLSGVKAGLNVEQEISSFEDLYQEFLRQLMYLTQCTMEVTNIYERRYPNIHSSLFFSSTYVAAVENGGDLYCDYSAKYNNSSINCMGIATAVDSLVAIKKLVFEDKKMSLKQFNDVLKSNWENHENLRLTIKNKYPRYGNGDMSVDSFATEIVKKLSDKINNAPNAKGGVFRLGTFSVDNRILYGKLMSASADGRLQEEPISQNAGATFGADREGATAHILSVTAMDATEVVNGSILDLDLHSSAVKGENGLCALRATLDTYLKRGGFGIHYNVLDAKILKEAQCNPDMYPNLQVRLCGWNVKFSELSPDVQNEFINRAR